MNPSGKAVLKAAEYLRPHEAPDDDYPYVLTTGRTLYHFHTRTKTARAPQLQDAAPEVWVEMSSHDAQALAAEEGDLLEVTTARSSIRARLRISGIRDGVAFVPFHYGYWDVDDSAGHGRAANEVTITDWDPASKQPIYKTAAAQIRRVGGGDGRPAPAPTTTGSRPVAGTVPATRGDSSAEVEETVERTAGGGL